MTTTGRRPSYLRRAVGRSQAGSVPLVGGAVTVAVGLSIFGWAWTRPIGKDPYTTLVDSMPTRSDYPYLVALLTGGVVLATLGLITVVVSAAIVVRRSTPPCGRCPEEPRPVRTTRGLRP